MNKVLCTAFLLFFSCISWSQVIDVDKLDQEISFLNAQEEYEAAILKLDSILDNPKATAYDRSHAYIQKSLTYKRVFNYPVALINLELAQKEQQDPLYQDELEIRILIERIFIYFDLQQNTKVDELLEMVDPQKLTLIKKETKAFYLSLLGVLAKRNGDYVTAESYLMQAKAILEKESPAHLPNIYRVFIVLYSELNQANKVFEAYKQGKYYADKYNMEIYKIIMEEAITQYYAYSKDYEKAYIAQGRVSLLRTKYNANSHSGKLGALEKELMEQRKALQLEKEKNLSWSLIFVAFVLIILLLVLWRLIVVSRHRRLLIEEDNLRMRKEIDLILHHQVEDKSDSVLQLAQYNLTARQLEIIEQVRLGKTNKEIGAVLFISENTVKYHLKAIYEVLNIYSRSELSINFKSDKLTKAEVALEPQELS